MFLLLPCVALAAETLARRYELEGEFRRLERREFRLRLTLEVENLGGKPLSDLQLMAYPNRFRTSLPNLNDVTFPLIYPGGTSTGSLRFISVRDGSGAELDARPMEAPGLPADVLWRVGLRRILAPGGKARVAVEYLLRVPEKFGSFGFYRGVLTMSGGWYPYLLPYSEERGFEPRAYPPLADWSLRLATDADAIVGGTYVGKGTGRIALDLPGRRELSVQFAEHLVSDRVSGRAQAVEIFAPKKDEEAFRPLRELAARWLEFVEREPELAGRPATLVLAQAPIRNALIVQGEGIAYVSDRAFKLLRSLEQYHTIPVVRGLFYQLLLPQASRRERSAEYHWVAEALAWHWSREFVRKTRYVHLDARRIGLIRFFAFHPTVDQLMYAPQFSAVDVYYDLVYPNDPVRDDALLFHHRIPFGRSIYSNMEDELGPDAVSRIVAVYAGRAAGTFREIASEVAGRDLSGRFAQWLGRRPAVNYVLEKHRVKKSPEGYDHEVRVRRVCAEPWSEPVELRVTPKEEAPFSLTWFGEGDEHLYAFRTGSPVRILEIDPRRRLLEYDLSDNRKPPRYKFILREFLFNYDISDNRPIVYVGTQFRRSHGGSNRYNAAAFLLEDNWGFDLGYSRFFGEVIDRLRMSHALGAGFGFRQFDRDLAAVPDPAGGGGRLVEVSPSKRATSLGVSYAIGNQLSLTNPLEGGYAGLSATWASRWFGGQADYYLVSQAASWIFKVHPRHLLALKEEFGISGPSGILSQAQYSLGGIGGMRGLSAGDDRYTGRYLFLLSAEYRHFWRTDLDWNLWFFRLRDIQGALFADAGNVADTVQERAEERLLGSSARGGFGRIFDATRWEADAGYGIRFLIQYFGVQPALLRFDVAKSLTDSTGVRYYFGVTQSF